MSDRPPSLELFGIEHCEGMTNGPMLDALLQGGVSGTTAAVWPTASQNIYIPIILEEPQTLQAFSFIVATASGNYDIGLFDEAGVARYRKGSTVVPAAGLAIVAATPTAVEPGCYWIGMVIDNITASVNRTNGIGGAAVGGGGLQRLMGVYTHSSAVLPLPSTAVYTAYSGLYVPYVNAHFVATQ